MNDKVSKRINAQKILYNGIYVLVDKIAQKIATLLPESQSVFKNQIADLSHVFRCDLGQNWTGIQMIGKGPLQPHYPYDIIKLHSLMIYSDLVKYIIVVVTKTLLMRYIFLFSRENMST